MRGLIAGVDEAGRGPIAGPVVAAAVILPPDVRFSYAVRDSKTLTARQRERAYEEILERAIAATWFSSDTSLIDSVNILQATLHAMREAVSRLDPKPTLVLVDGPIAPRSGIEERAIVGGDGKELSIAAASIVAKVVRDRIMCGLDSEHPVYGFARNKGYATPEHLTAVERYGPCAAHRMSFAPFVPRRAGWHGVVARPSRPC